MKKTVLLFLVLLVGTGSIGQISDISRKLIVTLQPNESLVYGENCFFLETGQQGIAFITVVNESKPAYYFHDQNQKKGPFEIPPVELLEQCKENSMFCGAYEQKNPELPDANIEPSGDKSFFKNNGKKYGPYEGIISVYLSKDGKNAAALVMNNSKMFFINSEGKEIPLAGNINEVTVSPDCKTFFAKTQGTVSLLEISKIDSQDMEALTKVFEDMEKQFMYLPNGNKLGPFNSSEISGLNCWFSGINPDHWLCSMDYDIFLNDSLLCTIENMPAKCDFYLNRDGRKYAWSSYENLCFYNGKCYPFPLAVNYIIENKKGYLTWVSVENGKDVVLYKMEF